jgi:HEAT repeat protein
MDSDKYLAEAGDQQWFPLLRDIAMKNAENLPYVTNAAKLGESNMVPSLLSLLSSPDKQFTVTNAVSSLGYTASRSAIPVLIDLLKEDRDIADRAAGSLQVLTHRRADGQPQEQYQKWLAWWTREGNTATVYKIGDCGDSIPLQ